MPTPWRSISARRSLKSMNGAVMGPVRNSRPTWMKVAPAASVTTVAPQRLPCSAISRMYDSGKKWAWVSMVGGCAMVSSGCLSGYLSFNKRMMNFHSSGSRGVIDSRLPRCRMRIRASGLWRRSSASGTRRVFFTNFTSTFTQRGAARFASAS
ncbi:hypothetical protein D3C83_17120 [compost metagenome]